MILRVYEMLIIQLINDYMINVFKISEIIIGEWR